MSDDALFPRLTPHEIDCLKPHGEIVEIEADAPVFREGERSDTFFILLEGRIRVTREVNGQTVFIASHDPGEFTGELTVLTRGDNVATGIALEPLKLLKIDFFSSMHRISGDCPELLTKIISALAQRRPEAMTLVNQREKLESLGVLAAGLAHELNNPASAARRSASQLRERLVSQRASAIHLCEAGVTGENLHRLHTALAEATERPRQQLDPLKRSDIETDIGERLSKIGVKDPWDVAAALVDAGVNPEEVAKLSQSLDCEGVRASLAWLADSLIVATLATEIEDASGRVAELVASVKQYSAMDQAPVQDVDVRTGIESTLTMLGHKLRGKSIEVEKEFDPATPNITGIPGELNQVWTNLIDNAIDAMPQGGRLKIRTLPEGECILVEIEDNGSGIPEEVQDRIFDPFFTTKPVGQGTGLGLGIAYKIVVDHHEGDMQVESEPGKTVFQIRLPGGAQ